MGFLNLSAWQPVGGQRPAERRATVVFAQPPKYYYEHLGEFQGIIDRFFEANGRRPRDLVELYLWQLDQEGAMDNDRRAADLADLISYYDLEPNSLLGMVSIDQDKAARARKLLEARRIERIKRRLAAQQPAPPATAGAQAA